MRAFRGIKLNTIKDPTIRQAFKAVVEHLRQVTGVFTNSVEQGQQPNAIIPASNTPTDNQVLKRTAGVTEWGAVPLSSIPNHLHTATEGGNIPETSITDGTLLARLAAAEIVTGSWTYQRAGAGTILVLKDSTGTHVANLNIPAWAADRTITLPDGTTTLVGLGITGQRFLKDVLFRSDTNAVVPLTIQRRNGSDPAHLTDWKDSNGTVMAYVDDNGGISANGDTYLKNVDVVGTFTWHDFVTADPRFFYIQNTPSGGGQIQVDDPFSASSLVTTNNNDVSQIDKTASIGDTTIFTDLGAGGFYRISLALICSTAGAAGTVTGYIKWTQRTVERTVSTAAMVLTSTSSSAQLVVPVRVTPYDTIKYGATVAGAVGTPKYDISVTVEWIGHV